MVLALAGTGYASTLIPNGDFETGDFTGWTSSGINGGYALLIQEGTCFSYNDTRGISFNGNFAANIRGNGATNSIGILTSNSFIADTTIKFLAVQYQTFVVKTAKIFFEQGLISEAERSAIVSAAAQSGCRQ